MSAHETLQERPEAAAPLYPPAPLTANKGFTPADVLLMAKLAADGKTQDEIAQRFGCSQPTVQYHLSKLGASTKELAEMTMDAALFKDAQRLNDLAENGKPDDAIKAIRTKWQSRGMLGDANSKQVNNIAIVLGVTLTAPGQGQGEV